MGIIYVYDSFTWMGLPINPSWQEQTARLFSTRHLVLSPHGDGVQKSPPPAERQLLAFIFTWV